MFRLVLAVLSMFVPALACGSRSELGVDGTRDRPASSDGGEPSESPGVTGGRSGGQGGAPGFAGATGGFGACASSASCGGSLSTCEGILAGSQSDCVACNCESCAPAWEACVRDRGCAAIMQCSVSYGCHLVECYQAATCRAIIDEAGGITATSAALAFEIGACTARFGCSSTCATVSTELVYDECRRTKLGQHPDCRDCSCARCGDRWQRCWGMPACRRLHEECVEESGCGGAQCIATEACIEGGETTPTEALEAFVSVLRCEDSGCAASCAAP
jgi:hypothetical protein